MQSLESENGFQTDTNNKEGKEMKTQAISNQNFNGNLKYVNKYITSVSGANAEKYLSNLVGKRQVQDAIRKLEREDFDLVVSRNPEDPKWFEIAPDSNIQPKSVVYVYETLMKSSFSEAVSTAIKQYKALITKTK